MSFLLGANLPWITYGGDFGANAWHPRGGLARGEGLTVLDRTLARLSRHGVRCIRWFMLCDGRAGVRVAEDGTPIGVDEFLFEDIDAALSVATAHGVAILFALLDFHWCSRRRIVCGVQTGGRRDVLRDARKRGELLARVITPLLERYGDNPAIAAWDIINEPEWATRGVGTIDRRVSISRTEMREFIGDSVRLVHRLTRHQATVGSASSCWLDLVRGLDLDVYQVHWYDKPDEVECLDSHVSSFGLDRPVLLGEFPTNGSRRTPQDILEAARASGFAGAFLWSVLSQDPASDYRRTEPGLLAWSRSTTHEQKRSET